MVTVWADDGPKLVGRSDKARLKPGVVVGVWWMVVGREVGVGWMVGWRVCRVSGVMVAKVWASGGGVNGHQVCWWMNGQ